MSKEKLSFQCYLVQKEIIIFNPTANLFLFSPSRSRMGLSILPASSSQHPRLPSSHSLISLEFNTQRHSSASILDMHGQNTISKPVFPSSTSSYPNLNNDNLKNKRSLQNINFFSLEIFFLSHCLIIVDLNHPNGLTSFHQLIWCTFLSLPLRDLWDRLVW